MVDHPIFTESIRRIRALLGETGFDPLQQQVLERLVHSSGDPGLLPLLRFSDGACERGLEALKNGALILTDTAMAAAAVTPMATRTLGTPVRCLLDWAPSQSPPGSTRSAAAMQRAWPELTAAASTAAWCRAAPSPKPTTSGWMASCPSRRYDLAALSGAARMRECSPRTIRPGPTPRWPSA